MAITAMRKTADLSGQTKPKARESIVKNAYVDDICDSVSNVKEARTLTSDIDEVLASGGFHVKKWVSNQQISAEEDSEEIVLGRDSQTEKVLGIVWLPKEDKFSVRIKNGTSKQIPPTEGPRPLPTEKLTKRQILSKLASVFDPVGVGSAVLVKPKIAMQELWQLGLGWDDEVPPNVKATWAVLFQEMAALHEIKFA